MNASIIEMSVEEVESNFDLCLTLCGRGHTIRITRQSGGSVLMVPIPEYEKALESIETAKDPNPPLPMPGGWQPDPVGVRQYVDEELTSMQKEFND